MAAAAAAIWLFQAPILFSAARLYTGGVMRSEGTSGSVTRGFTLTGFGVDTAGFSVYAAKVFIKPDLAAAFRGRPVIAELEISSPVVSIIPSPVKKGAASGRPPGLPEIRSAVITGGLINLPSGPPPVERINCGLSFKYGVLRADNCSVFYDGASALFSGSWSATVAELSGRAAYPLKKAYADFKYKLNGKKHLLYARGFVDKAALELNAVVNGEFWSGDLSAGGVLPLGLIKPGLRDLPLRSGHISASGRGFEPGAAIGSGKFSAEDAAFSAGGAISFNRGVYASSISFSSGPFIGSAEMGLAAGRLSGKWILSAPGDLAPPGTGGLIVRGFSSSGTLSGSVSAPYIKGAAEISGLEKGDLLAGSASLSFEAAPADGGKYLLDLAAYDLVSGARKADLLGVSAQGSKDYHSFAVSLSAGGSAFAVSGTGSIGDAGWKGTVDVAKLPVAGWALCEPFFVSVSSGGGLALDRFCLASGGSRIMASAALEGSAPEKIDVSISALDLSLLDEFGFTRLKTEGLLNAGANYRAGAPGSFKILATGLKLEGNDMGEVDASGSFLPGKVRLDASEWRIYGGGVKVSGSAGSGPGGVSADFAFEASTVNISPLMAFVPGIAAPEVWLKGAGSVSLKSGAFNTSGAVYIAVPRLSASAMGVELENLNVELSAEDISSALLKASASGKGGKLSAAGSVSAAGPEIKIKAAAFPFSHPSGLSAKASGEMEFSGAWKSPSLKGVIDLGEARFEMAKWDKYKPSGERSAFYESMAVDLGINAERNAWYKDGLSSVELTVGLFFKKEPYQQSSMFGTIEALRGYYVYMGNTFIVNSGRLTFSGENPPDPEIAVAASKEDRGAPYKVYFNATGTMRKPKIALSSDPAMEERDIISYLVTGRPLYEMYSQGNPNGQSAHGDVAAQNLAAGFLSQKAAMTVGRKLDLDIINLKVNPGNQADLTIGRYLTKDLFISYGQVLGQGGERRVSAEYSITKFLSLEGKNSSDGTYGTDLLFKFGIR